MTVIDTQGISLYYETHGDPGDPSVLLLSGLAGIGASWSSQISRFAAQHHVIVPDQRGTGRTSRTNVGHSTEQLAADMAIPDAELVVPACGHFVEHEMEDQFFDLVSGFIERHR